MPQKSNQLNYWKLATIILLFFSIFLSYGLYQQQQTYSFGTFEIEKNQFDKITDTLGGEFKLLQVCNFESCINIGGID